MKHLFYIILVFSLFSCGESAQKKENALAALPVLDLEAAFDNIDEADTSFLWNDIITNERFIPLETTDDCLIGQGIWTALLTGNHFLIYRIWGNKESVFLFDSCGHFIKPIAWQGKGPGELTGTLNHVIPFQNNQRIMINADYKMVIKNQNGDWIRDFKNNRLLYVGNMYPHDSGFVFVNQYERFPGDSTFLGFTDSLGNIVRELKEAGEKRPNPDENRQIMVKLNLRRIFFTDNHLWFMKSYNDTLFRITPKRTIEPYLILHRGKHAPMLNDKSDRIPIDILHYKEVGPYSFIAYSRLQIWNHETGRLVASRKIEKYTLLNSLGNFNYRLPDNRIIQINLMSVCNEKLIFITSPSVDDTLRDYLNLREDDNPVIMVAELKK